jgi:hypothetical protein
MKLSRFGFSLFVLIWLVPLTLLDIIDNVNVTGVAAEVLYYKIMGDVIILAFTVFQMFRGETMSVEKATRQQQAQSSADTIVSLENIGSLEYIYCAILFVLALGSWWVHHSVNINQTGFMSLLGLVWSFADIAIAVLAGWQFYLLKSGALVALKKKVLQ